MLGVQSLLIDILSLEFPRNSNEGTTTGMMVHRCSTIALVLLVVLTSSCEGNPGELRAAVARGDLKEVKRLVDRGANVNAKTSTGSTALHEAIFRREKLITEYLIQQGADVSAKGMYGVTPLHMAYDSPHFC